MDIVKDLDILQGKRRGSWTKEVSYIVIKEDEFLCELAKKFECREWTLIGKQFGIKFGEKEKTCKQLRQRFKNYLQYEQGNSLVKEWTPEQQKLLLDLYLEKGSKWTQISKLLLTKSESNIKNKFYGGLRKALRKINEIRKKYINKLKKPIQYSSLIRVLQIKQKSSTLPQKLKQQALSLREKIVKFSQHNISDEDSADIIEFCEELFRFNFSSRCYRVRKTGQKKVSSDFIQVSGTKYDMSEDNCQSIEDKQSVFKSESRAMEIKGQQKVKELTMMDQNRKLPASFNEGGIESVKKEIKIQADQNSMKIQPKFTQILSGSSAFTPFIRQSMKSSNSFSMMSQLAELRGNKSVQQNQVWQASESTHEKQFQSF